MAKLKSQESSYWPNKKEQTEEIYKCGTDVKYFTNKYVKISHPKKGLVKFHTFPYQEDCLEAFQKHRYVIVNKSRQLGLSTASAAYALWLALFQREKNILVVATKLDTAQNFIRKVRTALDHLPDWLVMPKLTEDTKKSLSFSNGSKIKAIPTSADAGRSESLSLMIIDEAAHIEGVSDLWLGLQPTLSNGGSVIFISTPNGAQGLFYDLWIGAKQGENGFHSIELPWHVHPERDEKWFQRERKALLQAKGEMGVAQELLCVGPDTNIITSNGCKKIKDIEIGDLVLTHKGRFKKVEKTYCRQIGEHENLYSVSTPGNRKNDILITGNHPILNYAFKVPKGKNNKKHFRKLHKNLLVENKFESLDDLLLWKHETNHTRRVIYGCLFPHLQFENILEDNSRKKKYIDLAQFDVANKTVTDNFVKYSRQKSCLKTKRYIPIDFNLGRFIGLCAAEGHVRHNVVGLAFHHQEIDTLGKFCRDYLSNLGYNYFDCKRSYSKCYVILSSNRFARALIRHFIYDGDARTKHYNMENIIKTNKEFIRGLIVGHFEGDGDHPFFHDLDNKLKVVCKSEKMLYQLRTFLSLFGHYTRIGYWNNEPSYLEFDGLTKIKDPKKRNIFTLTDQVHTKEFLDRPTSRSFLLPKEYFVGGFQYQKATLKAGGKMVYNLEVEDDHSYIADSLIVHNCLYQASGDTFLKGEALEKIMLAVKEPIERRAHGRYETWIWKYPEPGHEYIVSGDVARGDGEDFSAFHVIDTTAEEVVADFQGKNPPDEFAEILMQYGRQYNTAMICQELNSVGVACAQKLKEAAYPKLFYEKFQKNIYMTYVSNEVGPNDFPGLTVNQRTREEILAKLENNLRNGFLKVYSKRLFEELQTFIWKRNKPQAIKGKNDDLVMCYDQETEVLTEKGWKYFSDVKSGDMVYSLNIKTGNLELATNLETVDKFVVDRPMINFHTRQVDLLVTENHRMLVSVSAGGNTYRPWSFVEAEKLTGKHFRLKRNIDNWQGNKRESITIPGFSSKNGRKKPNLILPMKDFMLLLGFFISEGSGNKNRLFLSQCYKSKAYIPMQELLERLSDLGVSYAYRPQNNSFEIMDTRLATFIKALVPGIAPTKRIPREFLDLDIPALEQLFLGLFLGDGCRNKKGELTNYVTTSPGLAADVVELVLKLRLSSIVLTPPNYLKQTGGTINGRTIRSKHQTHIVSISRRHNEPRINHHEKNQATKQFYTGKVGCLILDKNHTLFVKRNGKAVWSGNSLAIGCDLFEASGRNQFQNTEAQWALVKGMSVETRVLNPLTGKTSDGFFSLPSPVTRATPGSTEYRKHLDSEAHRGLNSRQVHDYNNQVWDPFRWMFGRD
jgi:intein/homing endonuclease